MRLHLFFKTYTLFFRHSSPKGISSTMIYWKYLLNGVLEYSQPNPQAALWCLPCQDWGSTNPNTYTSQ